MDIIWHGIRDALLMAWEVWWALVLGFAISAIVQAWVPRERVQAALGSGGAGATARATALGAASSSCSYAAVAIARSLLAKGASATSALAFQLASTNLVWELGLVLWVLIGWQFTVAEYLGGLVMIGLIAVMLRWFVSPRAERRAREHAAHAPAGGGHDHHEHDHAGHDHAGHDHAAHDHCHHGASASASTGTWRERLTSRTAWAEVASYFRMDVAMVWREVAIGFVLAGFAAQIPGHVLRALFVHGAPAPIPAVENALIGPLIAVVSFVCSVGNVPLAAVLWSGGIGFSGVLAFLFADLIVLQIIAVYRRYYGTAFALRITALLFVTMVIAALIVAAVFHVLGLVPTGARPTRADVFAGVALNYKLVLNVIAAAIFAALWWLRARPTADRGTEPEPECPAHGRAGHAPTVTPPS